MNTRPAFRLTLLAIASTMFASAGCSNGAPTTVAVAALESCFDVGGGQVECMKTPGGAQTQPTDVNHDGKDDTFVCATGPTGKVSGDDGDGDRDGVPDQEDCDNKGCVAVAQQPALETDEHHGGTGGATDAGGDGHDGDDMDCPAAAAP